MAWLHSHPRRRRTALRRHLQGGPLLERCLSTWAPAHGVVWYPSAGDDYRDLMELTEARRRLHGLRRLPHLFIHTDVLTGWHRSGPSAVLYADPRTRVEVLAAEPVYPSSHLATTVGLHDAEFASQFSDLGGGWLMRVRCQSRQLGVSEAWLLRLECQNYDFFVRLAIQAGLQIDTFVQVRQGLGCGGCRLGTSYLLPWLAGVGVREVICDGEFHGSPDQFAVVSQNLLREGAPAEVRLPEVTHREQPFLWSGFTVDAGQVRTKGTSSSLVDAWRHAQRAFTHPASTWTSR